MWWTAPALGIETCHDGSVEKNIKGAIHHEQHYHHRPGYRKVEFLRPLRQRVRQDGQDGAVEAVPGSGLLRVAWVMVTVTVHSIRLR